MKLGILNYDCGNIWSVKNAFDYFKVDTKIISTEKEILNSDCLVLPGDGSYKMIKEIKKKKLIESLDYMAKTKQIPILGICLGMQLFGTSSEETNFSDEGLNWISGKLTKFNIKKKIPHIGFNSLLNFKNDKLFYNIDNLSKFYFVHSYYFHAENKKDVIAETKYDIFFPSVIKKENIVGTQFHPEKSQNHGIQFLYNFLNSYGLL